jgi:hypothetical protein
MSLRKSNTFNARTNSSSDLGSPVEHARYMPKRSPTSPKALEDLLNREQDRRVAHQQDVATLLRDFDNKINGRTSIGGDCSILKERDVLALPSFMIEQVIVPDPMDIDVKEEVIVDHQHDSDSGLGSSVASSTIGIIGPVDNVDNSPSYHLASTDGHKEQQHPRRSTRGSTRSISTSHSAITASSGSTHSPSQHFLSSDAVRHIKKHIVQPILKEESLKEFHPLIEDVPRRIGARFISNLRDLEKTLFFLAPVSESHIYVLFRALAHAFLALKEFSSSARSFLKFCETSIQCLHTTVDYLSERDQRLPTDRPYTNNYFLDLVEQIRRYAQIMARTRAKEAAGEALDDMDYSPYVIPVSLVPFHPSCSDSCLGLSHPPPLISPLSLPLPHSMSNIYLLLLPYRDEEIAIAGGLSQNGKPAELVRKKDGKVIPISEHSNLDADEGPSSVKRHLTDDDMDDDDVRRSMARRRKSDKPGDVMHPCAVCDKEFKRPCDLTKHEKTHSRPWKCHDIKCRYHDQGWPTEKERDRHVNDKHSQAPTMYKCKFPPCTYSSKRESNCKQHMEKAHNWQYVRSKSNGRKKAGTESSSSGRTPSEPLTPFIATPASVTHHNFSSPESPFLASPSVQPESAGFGGFGDYRYTPGPSTEDIFAYDTRRESVTTAGTGMTYSSGFSPDQHPGSAFEEALTPDDLQFNHGSLFDNSPAALNFGNTPFQQPTPAMSVNHGFEYTDSANLGNTFANSSNQHLSPTAQPDLTLYSPHLDNIHFDEALGGNLDLSSDFTLFDTMTPSNNHVANVSGQNWFQDMNFGSVGGQFDNFQFPSGGEDAFQH